MHLYIYKRSYFKRFQQYFLLQTIHTESLTDRYSKIIIPIIQ